MKQKDIFLLLVPMFLFILAWIVFNIYHNSLTSTISEKLNKSITPISPDFDMETINLLGAREKIAPVFEYKTPTSENQASPSGKAQEEGKNLP